jgi:hypothetical protein
MSDMIDHHLVAPNLKQLLLKSGVIESRILHGTSNREVEHQYVINMQKCNETYWKEVEDSAKEYGVVDFSKKNDDGRYGVRRDLTEQEIEELPYWPIFFNSDDEVNWVCKWHCNDDPAFFISKLFPEITFEYNMYYEGKWDGGFSVSNGIFDEMEEWLIYADAIEHQKAYAWDDVGNYEGNTYKSTFICIDCSEMNDDSDDTLPF